MSGSSILGVIVLAVLCTMIILAFNRSQYRRRDRDEAPEIETMQEMNSGLQRMEDRIEVLETLLMDTRKKSKAKSEFE